MARIKSGQRSRGQCIAVAGTWKSIAKPLILPGGILCLLAVVVLQGRLIVFPASTANFSFFAVFIAGLLLAWRFHSSRIFFALLVLFLSKQAVEFFSGGQVPTIGPGRIALEAISFLLPLNLVFLSLVRERGMTLQAMSSRAAVLFVESVFVAIICRPSAISGPALFRSGFFPHSAFGWTSIPQIAWLVFVLAEASLLARFWLYRKPVESGLFWSLAVAFLGLQAGGGGKTSAAYFAVGGVILAASLIENTYVLAYHDELTSLPGRRAFNEALLRLQPPYAIAAVDIDHFKSFNDTYGHDTGDHILRLVASKLAHVSGDGRAFRVGGEEFSILFDGKRLSDALPHLEALREEIEGSRFVVRNRVERRRPTARGTDRRKALHGKPARRRTTASTSSTPLAVTVSIGAAEQTPKIRETDQVVRAADVALYRAKQSGRNRVEAAGVSPDTKYNIA